MKFYNSKQVLVTGGASFIGSHLVDQLVVFGANVTVVDDLSSGKRENLTNSEHDINFIEGDLRDQNLAYSSFQDQEIIFHLANVHGGRGFIETHPGEIAQNFLIDANVILAAQKSGVDRVCYTSSACAYPTNLQTASGSKKTRYLSEELADPFTEGCALADGEYGWAKFMGEMTLSAYHKQFAMRGVSCRLFTVYGPRENESHAIIAFIAKALMMQDPFEVWGSGQQDRNFTYVGDIVKGLLLATEKITDCRPINLGSNEITKIIDAAKQVCQIVGHKPKIFKCDTSKPEGVHRRAACIENQKKWLGWYPQTLFKDGIIETIDWYSQNTNLGELCETLDHKLYER